MTITIDLPEQAYRRLAAIAAIHRHAPEQELKLAALCHVLNCERVYELGKDDRGIAPSLEPIGDL